MYQHFEEGTLTRGADGALYRLSPGRCERVDSHSNEARESGTMDGKVVCDEDVAFLDDHMPASLVVDPGDQVSARAFVDPGDQVSARAFVDPGDQVSARAFVDPGDQVSARAFVDPGDQVSARAFVDPGEGLIH